jgi:hypothetical protein
MYIAIHVFLYRPITAHVYGHELTHVIWAWIFGGEVKQFKAAKEGGRVIVTKSNFFIRLAPYFFPLYSMIVIILYGLISLFVTHPAWFLACALLLGMTIGFHIAMTVYSLKTIQTDLSATGYQFSITFILIMNMVVLMFFLSIFFTIGYLQFLWDSAVESLRIFRKVYYIVVPS